MARARVVRGKKEGKIDTSRFLCKRRIDDDDVTARLRTLFEDVAKSGKTVNWSQPIYNEQLGAYQWIPESKMPEVIDELARQCRGIFNLKSEVTNYGVYCWKPAPSSPGTKFDKTWTLPPSGSAVGSRIVITMGHREFFKMGAAARAGSGTASLLSNAGDCFAVPVGVAAGLSLSFDNSSVVIAEPKKGFRKGRRLTKDSKARYIIVIDFQVNTELLVREIKASAEKLTGGDVAKSKELESRAAREFYPNDVNQVVAQASAVKAPVT